MSRNTIFIVIIFLAGLICIVGGYIILLSADDAVVDNVLGIGTTTESLEHSGTKHRSASIDKEENLKKLTEKNLSIAEAVKRFEEEKRKEQKSESEQEAKRKKIENLVDTATKDLADDSNSERYKSEIAKIKRGQKPDPEVYQEIIRRKAQENKNRLRKAEKEGIFSPEPN